MLSLLEVAGLGTGPVLLESQPRCLHVVGVDEPPQVLIPRHPVAALLFGRGAVEYVEGIVEDVLSGALFMLPIGNFCEVGGLRKLEPARAQLLLRPLAPGDIAQLPQDALLTVYFYGFAGHKIGGLFGSLHQGGLKVEHLPVLRQFRRPPVAVGKVLPCHQIHTPLADGLLARAAEGTHPGIVDIDASPPGPACDGNAVRRMVEDLRKFFLAYPQRLFLLLHLPVGIVQPESHLDGGDEDGFRRAFDHVSVGRNPVRFFNHFRLSGV